jgi:hypothetical protein
MRQYTLNLIVDNKPLSAFIKANSALLSKFEVKDAGDLIKIWKTEYNADLELPDRLLFSSEADLTMFLIKWS